MRPLIVTIFTPKGHEILERDYPKYFHGAVLPFRCAFVNMSDIPDSDCLACEDVAAGMGIAAMAHAYDKDKLLEILPKFKPLLEKLPDSEVSCLLNKISIYLGEYLGEEVLKELDMAFKSIGQKYGFVSAGDVYRQRIAEERQKADAERQKAENAETEKLNTARKMVSDGIISVENAMAYFGYTKEQILAR